MKLVPFVKWVKFFLDEGYEIISYVGIRADETWREGYVLTQNFLTTKMLFAEDGLVNVDIINILEGTGLGLTKYYEWRSRIGCTFCFYQRKIEWVRLKERHPEKFEEAKAYEKQLVDEKSTNGETYYWMGKNTPLSTLEEPERIAQIKADHEKKLEKFKKKRRRNALYDDQLIEMIDLDAVYDEVEGAGACVTCYK